MSVPPPTKLILRGDRARMMVSRLTLRRSRVTSTCSELFCAMRPSDVLEAAAAEHPVSLEELLDSVVEAAFRLETGLPEALVGDDVVALVRVASDLGEMDVETRHVRLD